MQHLSFRTLTSMIVAGAAVVALGIWYFSRPEPAPSPELGSPVLCLASVDPAQRLKPLFFDRAALPWIKQHWQDWAGSYGESRATPEELASEFDRGLQSPGVWRSMDRKWRFGAVLLTGDPVAFRPLLDSLRTAPDWKLKRIDPTSYLFVRVESDAGLVRSWNTALDTPALLAFFDEYPRREQIMARVQIAHRLMFLEEYPAARGLLEEAFKLDPKSKEAWTEMASLHGMVNKWQEAARDAERALSRDDRYRPALLVLATAYNALGRYDDALNASRGLYSMGSVDADVLYLHAKITHSAHAYQEEAEVLGRLITLLQGRAQPVGIWQIYLGQALSATGENLLAADQFRNAIKDETLRPSDREFIQTALQRLDSKQEIPINYTPGGK